jgi:hypothetical protein
MRYCEDCGCAVYNGHCVNCHEEVFIAEQHMDLGTWNECSQEFKDKVMQQEANPQDGLK